MLQLTDRNQILIRTLSFVDTLRVFNRNSVKCWEIKQAPPETSTTTERHPTMIYAGESHNKLDRNHLKLQEKEHVNSHYSSTMGSLQAVCVNNIKVIKSITWLAKYLGYMYKGI